MQERTDRIDVVDQACWAVSRSMLGDYYGRTTPCPNSPTQYVKSSGQSIRISLSIDAHTLSTSFTVDITSTCYQRPSLLPGCDPDLRQLTLSLPPRQMGNLGHGDTPVLQVVLHWP